MSLFAHPDPSHPLIAPHPRTADVRRNSLIGLIVAVCSVAYLVFDGWTR